MEMQCPCKRLSRYIRVFCAGVAITCFYAILVTLLQLPNQDKETVTSLLLSYKHPQTGEMGKAFNISQNLLDQIMVTTKLHTHIQVHADSLDDIVFVTAVDFGHFEEAFDTIASIQYHFPQKKIILYDLGLTSAQIEQVQTFCNVVYRRFNFNKYPSHVKDLKLYSWKAVILWEVLTLHTGLLWFDSSVRLDTNNFNFTKDTIINANGIALLTTTGHSTFAVTHPDMYLYLPTNQELARSREQRAMTACILFRTKTVMEDILIWLLLCSLDPQCISPTWNRFCTFEDRFDEYAGCHRFDQSAMNILLLNLYNYDNYMFYPDKQTGVNVERMITEYFKLQICK